MSDTSGRRARKKAATRKTIGDAALALFLENGFDHVGVREIAEAADVSVTTLFNHYPSKEALAFDSEDEIDEALIAAVQGCDSERDIIPALRNYIVHLATTVASYPHAAAFEAMIESTPTLRTYGRRVWLRHETTLAHAIAEKIGVDPDNVTCKSVARFTLEAFDLAHNDPNPEGAINEIFSLLEHGWQGVRPHDQ